MADTSQSDIDALMEGVSSENLSDSLPSTDAESPNETSASPEDTKELPIGQEKETSDDFITSQSLATNKAQGANANPASQPEKDPRGVPWVDFYPEFTHKPPTDLVERMKEELDNHRIKLENKELFKLRTLEIKIHRSYYLNWVHEANQILFNAVRIKTRMKRIEARKAKKSS